MRSYDLPRGALLDEAGNLTPAWAVWFTTSHNSVRTLRDSGTTSERPDNLLWVGRTYYDTDLEKPIWLHAINPIVWHDATGAPV